MKSLNEHKLINEAKKRYSDIEGLKTIKVDYEDEYTGKLQLGNSGIYAPKWSIEEPIAETPKHILVSGFDQGGDDEMNVYIVINKKKGNIIDYQHWGYDKLLPIYFKNAKVKESNVNEAKKRYNNIKGLNREFGDGDEYDTGIQRYWGNERKGTFVYAYNSQIENPMAETPKHILVSGYEDYGDDTKNAFLVINKKKREIIDYDVWDYDNLLPIYFKNVKLKRTSAYESKVNEGKKYKIKELFNVWDEVYAEDMSNEYGSFIDDISKNYKAGITKSEIAELWDKYYGEDIADEYSGFYDKLKESNVNESDEQMSEMKIREAMAESGKTRVNDLMKYMKAHYAGKYDIKVARENAKELVADMKKYM